jgi:hypothetical protein
VAGVFLVRVILAGSEADSILHTLRAHVQLGPEPGTRPGEYTAHASAQGVEVGQVMASTASMLDREHPNWRQYIALIAPPA